MKKYLPPALGLIVATAILLAVNEFAPFSFARDYALVFILGGMFLGVWAGKLIKKNQTL